MKKLYVLLVFASMLAQGQVKVLSNGNVGIGTTNPGTQFQIEGNTNGWMQQIKATVTDPGNFVGIKFLTGFPGEYYKFAGIAAVSESVYSNNTGLAFYTNQAEKVRINANGNVNIGNPNPSAKLNIEATNIPSFFARTYGSGNYGDAVKSQVNQWSTRAFVVYNYIDGLQKWYVDGAGNTWSTGTGSFAGPVYSAGMQLYSDRKLKSNIKTCNNALAKILQMRGVNYNMVDSLEIEQITVSTDTTQPAQISSTAVANKSNQNAIKTITERKKVKIAFGDSSTKLKTQYGFIAQELETILPEVVSYNTKMGLKTVNYIAIIPILVEAMKEQNTKIETLEAKVKKLEKGKTSATDARVEAANTTLAGTYLYQNTPNPFSQETQIRYSIPETAHNAFITITDLSGKQIKALPIATKGESYVTLKANELYAGLFAYTLVVDGNIVDSKRMVIVE